MRQRWNTMRDMRVAFDMPDGLEAMDKFLIYWDKLGTADRLKLRTMDLTKFKVGDVPVPEGAFPNAKE